MFTVQSNAYCVSWRSKPSKPIGSRELGGPSAEFPHSDHLPEVRAKAALLFGELDLERIELGQGLIGAQFGLMPLDAIGVQVKSDLAVQSLRHDQTHALGGRGR